MCRIVGDPRGKGYAVPQVKRRIYSQGVFDTPTLTASLSPVLVAAHNAPHATTDTFLRARFEFTMSVLIGSSTADVPPEEWWARAAAEIQLSWRPDSTHTPIAFNGNSEHFLGSQLLTPRLTPSPSSPTEYVVQWSQKTALVTETSRKDVTAVSGPSVTAGLGLWDPDSALDGTYTAVAIHWFWRLFTLWGSST